MNRQRTATLAKTSLAVVAVFLAAGCSRSMPSLGGYGSANAGPSPLAPAPAGQVAARQLPPPPPPPPPGGTQSNETMTDQAANTPTSSPDGTPAGGDTQVASLENKPSTPPSSGGGGSISRNSVLGAYKVTTTGGNCQIILSLTKWTGGYRAASRGCPGAVADVSAWDVSGSQVLLKDSGGSQVASLSKSGGSRYDGQTKGGQAISLYR